MRRSMVASGSSVRPEWTGETCTTVLRGATSQWKRSFMESWPMGPASGPPAQIRGMADRCSRIKVHVRVRRERTKPRLVQLDAGGEQVPGEAVEENSGVDELRAVHPRHHAEHGVIKRAGPVPGELRDDAARSPGTLSPSARPSAPAIHSAINVRTP